jgi:hypothetical protein
MIIIDDTSTYYYKHITILNDDSSIISKWLESLNDDARVVIYNHKMFIIQATAKAKAMIHQKYRLHLQSSHTIFIYDRHNIFAVQ